MANFALCRKFALFDQQVREAFGSLFESNAFDDAIIMMENIKKVYKNVSIIFTGL